MLKRILILLSRLFTIILFVILLMSSLSIYSYSFELKKTRLPSENDIIWSKTFGRFFSDEVGFSVDTTSDGGYIVVGTAYYSRGGGIWLMKLDSYGDVEWKKIFGGFGVTGMYVKQTSDGGYVIATADMRVIKTDSSGNIEWTYIPSKECWCWGDRLVQETSDGGYIVVGTLEYEDSVDCDVYLVKLSNNGDMLWNKAFGGLDRDVGGSIYPTSDGGFIIAGGTHSFSSDSDYTSLWVIKTDSNGNMIWNKSFIESTPGRGFSVQQTSDGGYIIAGKTQGVDIVGWLVKIDEYGDMEWDLPVYKCSVFYSVEETREGGFIATGTSGISIITSGDLYIVKVDSTGTVEWIRSYGRDGFYEEGNCIRQTSDGGYIVVGYKDMSMISSPYPLKDIWVLKTDIDGYCMDFGYRDMFSREEWLK